MIAVNRGLKRALLALAALVSLLAPDLGWARGGPFVNTMGRRPQGDPEGTLYQQSGKVTPKGQFRAGIVFDYALNPLIGRDGGEKSDTVVGNRFTSHFLLNAGMHERVSIGLHMPLILFQNGEDLALQDRAGISAAATGDLEVVPKFQLLRADEHLVDLALLPVFTLPSSSDGALAGERTLSFIPQVAVSGDAYPFLRLIGTLGYRVRRDESAVDLSVGDEIVYRLGARAEIPGMPTQILVRGELAGSTRASRPFSRSAESPLEGVVGGRVDLGFAREGLGMGVDVGAGLVPGYGAPTFRFLMSVGYQLPIPGTDAARSAAIAAGELPGDVVLEAECTAAQMEVDGAELAGDASGPLDTSGINFLQDSARLDVGADANLDSLALRARCTPGGTVLIRVAMPAGDLPDLSRRLAKARARTLFEALRARNVDPTRLRAEGVIASSDADEGVSVDIIAKTDAGGAKSARAPR